MKKIFFSKRCLLFYLTIFFCLTGLSAQAADPVVVEVHYQNGVKFYKRGLYTKAIQAFEKTLSLDPERKDAKEYLEKVKAEQKEKKEIEAGMSKDTLLQNLYQEGRQLYAKGDYEAALEVFHKILALKPVDEFASFHKESCEIFISRKLARQKKIEDKEKLKERKEQERLNRKKEAEAKKAERREMLEKRAEINEERLRQRQEREVRVKTEAQTSALNRQEEKQKTRQEKLDEKKEEKAKKVEGKQKAREKKLSERQQRLEAARKTKEDRQAERQQKFEAAKGARGENRAAVQESKERRSAERRDRREARIEAKKKAREEEREASRQRKVEKAAEKEEKVLHRKKAAQEGKQEKAVRQSVKELYIQGVENYAKKLYTDAIASFEAVIEAESRAGTQIYTNTAKRLMEKAKKKQEGAAIL